MKEHTFIIGFVTILLAIWIPLILYFNTIASKYYIIGTIEWGMFLAAEIIISISFLYLIVYLMER